MTSVKSTETVRPSWFSTLARKAFSLPALLGVLLVAAACLGRYLNLLNTSLHRGIYSAYCFEGDTWWHLATGQLVLKTHVWPNYDTFSFTAYGNAWMAYEWAGDILMATVWRLGEMYGLMILLVVLAGITLLLLYYYAFLRTRNVQAAFLACALLLPLASLSFSMRPQILGEIFLIITLICMERFRQGRHRDLWILPFLFLLWINIHGTFVLGFVILGVYWATGLRELHFGPIHGVRWTPGERRHIAMIFLLSLLACTITPYGTRLAAYPIEMEFLQPLNLQVVPEWHSLNFGLLYGKWFLILLFLFFVGQLARRQTYRLAEVVLLILATVETFLHGRFMLFFVPVFTPLLALFLAGWIPERNTAKERPLRNFVLSVAACWAMVFFFPSRAKLQEAVALWNPVGAVHYLQEHPVPGPMLNFDDWGGYLIATLKHKVFIDGRLDVYEPGGVLLDYLYIMQVQPKTLFLLRKYQVRSCLIPPNRRLASLLAELPDWKEVYRDKRSVLFVRSSRDSGGSQEVIPR